MSDGPVERLPGGARSIALTFDDGPDPAVTPRVLASLVDRDLVATFFVLGEHAVAHPELIEALLSAGMGVGVHGWDHTEVRGAPADVVADQIGRTAECLRGLGASPTLFRPTYGRWDAGVLEVADRAALTTVGWTIDPVDWQSPTTDEVVDRVVAGLAPGAIVLLHDGGSGSREGTVSAIPRLAYFVREAAGYQVVDLAEALAGQGSVAAPPPGG